MGAALSGTVGVMAGKQPLKHDIEDLDKIEDIYPIPFDSDIQYPFNLRLLQAHVFFRHGDRSPIWAPVQEQTTKHWVCENETTSEKGVCYPGQLTTRGKMQLTKLGVMLRELYMVKAKVLSTSYDAHEVVASSTDVPRTRQSVINVLKGLFPMSYARGERIPLFVRETDSEILYPDIVQCPKLAAFYKAYRSTDKYKEESLLDQKIKKELATVFEMTDKTGRKPTLTDVFDYMMCLRENGFRVPFGMSEQLYQDMHTISARHWWGPFQNSREISRLGIGRAVQEVISRMHSRIDGKEDYKLLLYSGHDSTVGPLLGALQVFNNKWPNYSAYCVVELFQDRQTRDSFVRFIYNGKVIPLPYSQEKDKQFCKLEHFKKGVEPILPVNFVEECKV